MKKIFGGIIIVLIGVIYGCEYNKEEVFFRDVDKNVSPPDLTIDLNLNSDTTYFYTNPNVVLSLKLTNKEIYGVKFFVNDVEVENVYNDQQRYSISINASDNSPMKVRAKIYTSTGTGSIADRVNAESFVTETKEWVLVYVPEKPVVKIELVNGRLKLSWTPIKSSVKLKYYIYSTRHSNYLVDSTYNNWYIDSSYYGGSNDYSIRYGKNDISGYLANIIFVWGLPQVSINTKDSFYICWGKSEFYNSINGYRLRIDYDTIELKPNDTSYVYKHGRLGKNYSVCLELSLKNTFYYRYSKYLNLKTANVNYPSSFLPDYNFFTANYFPLTGSSFYYGSTVDNKTYLYKFSLDSKSVIASKKLWTNYFSVSPNNKYILYEDQTSGYSLKLLGTNNLEEIASIPTSQIASYSSIVISDIGTSVTYDQFMKTMLVYDIINKKSIAKVQVTNLIRQYKISAEGKYIFVPEVNTLYKVENNSCINVWNNSSMSNQFKYFDFFPDNQEKICLYDGSTFYIKNCSDFSTIHSFSINDKTIVNVDFTNQKILCVANNNYYIFSLTNGDLLRTIPTSIYYSDRARLFYDYIIYNNCQLNLKNQ